MDRLAALENARKEVQARPGAAAERNTRSRDIGRAKAQGEDIETLKASIAELGDQLAAAEAGRRIQGDLNARCWQCPTCRTTQCRMVPTSVTMSN